MTSFITRKTQHSYTYFWTLLVSIAIVLLSDWGRPDIFPSIPFMYIKLFMNALRVYTACCVFYFCIHNFIISFIPAVVFSIAVLMNTSFNNLNLFTEGCYYFSIITICISSFINLLHCESSQKEFFKIDFIVSTTILLTSIIVYLLNIARLFADVFYLILIICSKLFIQYQNKDKVNSLSNNQTELLTSNEIKNHFSELDKFSLSEREKEIAEHLLLGETNQQIADKLFISIATVKTHITNIFNKTNTKNRMRFARLALKINQPKD